MYLRSLLAIYEGTHDRSLRVQVVHESRDRIGVGDGSLRQVNWTEADDTINAIESRSRGGRAKGLRRYSQAGVRDRTNILGTRDTARSVSHGERIARAGAARRRDCITSASLHILRYRAVR
jgi:hypothetical protein